jgi:hypothetical protein
MFVGISFVSSLDGQPELLFSYPPVPQQDQKRVGYRVSFPKNVKKAKTYAEKDKEDHKLYGIPVSLLLYPISKHYVARSASKL